MRSGVGPTHPTGGLGVEDGLGFSRDDVGLVVHLNPPPIADVADVAIPERAPLIEEAAHAVGIPELEGAGDRGFTHELLGIRPYQIGGLELDGPGVIGAQHPLHLIGVMRAHVRVHSFAGVPEIGPAMDAPGHERPPLNRSQPHVVIPAIRHGCGGLVREGGAGPHLHIHGMNAADAPLPDHLAGELI